MRLGLVARVHQVVRTTLVRPPGTRCVSSKEAREEYQREDQDRKHGGSPVFAPRSSSFQSCDDIMIPDAEKLFIS
jgi:hypothetical protein